MSTTRTPCLKCSHLNVLSATPSRPLTIPLHLLTPMAVSKSGMHAFLVNKFLLQPVRRLERHGTTSCPSIPLRTTSCVTFKKGLKYTSRQTLSFVTQTQPQTHLHHRAKDRSFLGMVCSFLLLPRFCIAHPCCRNHPNY